MPSGSKRPFTQKQWNEKAAAKMREKAGQNTGMTSEIYNAIATDLLTGKRKAPRKSREKK